MANPLFRTKDAASMKSARGLDPSNYDDVRAHAGAILARLEAGSMPCDGAWPADRVALFAKWISDGKLP